MPTISGQRLRGRLKPTNDLAEISAKAGDAGRSRRLPYDVRRRLCLRRACAGRPVKKLLTERPAIAGITLPGMPMGSPGMPGVKKAPLTIYAFTKDGKAPTVYATE